MGRKGALKVMKGDEEGTVGGRVWKVWWPIEHPSMGLWGGGMLRRGKHHGKESRRRH